MLSRVLAIIVATLIFLAGFILLIQQRVGELRPALLPPTQDISTVIEESSDKQQIPQKPQGETENFPLNLTEDFQISVFAKNLGKARDLEFSPGGTLLVSLIDTGRVVALPDTDNDGKADQAKAILTRLDQPHGLAFFTFTTATGQQNKLFVAEETTVIRYNWDEEQLSAKQDKVLFGLPRGNRHFTRSLAFDYAGRLFVSLGSSCDTCVEQHPWFASVIVSDAEGHNPRLYATGLRNSVFITFNQQTKQLWGTEMGRDFLGDNLPPDEVNLIKDGRDYGWPYCYGKQVHDRKFDPKLTKQIHCTTTEPPLYEIPAHAAPLGLVFVDSQQFPDEWQGDLLVAYHGSWNRSTPVGYKVVRLKVKDQEIAATEDFITGWLQGDNALGRPVDLLFGQDGTLYISDDKAGVVYTVVGR